MSFFLDFEHTVRGRTLEETFKAVESWLNTEPGKIKESHPPSRIVAAHGHALQPLGWRADARKTIAFELEPANSDVHVRVRITPASLNATDVRMRSDEARANWNELLAHLWARLGEAEAVAEAIRNPPVDWGASLRRGKMRLTAGGILSVFGVAVGISFGYASPAFWIGTGVLVIGVLSLVYGGMTVLSAKRRISAQRKGSGP